MRVFFLILLGFMLLSGCGANNKSTSDQSNKKTAPAMMKFVNETADFGTVKEGEKVVLFYTFENTGGSDLVIYEALPSCGCATPKYDTTPIKPGEKRTVEITFDSEGWSGAQQKSITFKTNGVPDYATVTLTGIVE
jgi:Protein of unknown function (DUF1573).